MGQKQARRQGFYKWGMWRIISSRGSWVNAHFLALKLVNKWGGGIFGGDQRSLIWVTKFISSYKERNRDIATKYICTRSSDVKYVVVVGLSIPPFPREHLGQTLLSLKMIDSLHLVGRLKPALLLEKYGKDEGQIYYIS